MKCYSDRCKLIETWGKMCWDREKSSETPKRAFAVSSQMRTFRNMNILYENVHTFEWVEKIPFLIETNWKSYSSRSKTMWHRFIIYEIFYLILMGTQAGSSQYLISFGSLKLNHRATILEPIPTWISNMTDFMGVFHTMTQPHDIEFPCANEFENEFHFLDNCRNICAYLVKVHVIVWDVLSLKCVCLNWQ